MLSVESVERNGIVVVGVAGEVDIATAAQLADGLDRAVQAGGGAVLVDLSDVEFMDSSGLAVLLNALTRMTRGGRRFALAAPPESAVLRLLEQTRLDTTFATFPDADRARDWLSSSASAPAVVTAPAARHANGGAELESVSQAEAARQTGVAGATLRRWAAEGVVSADAGWTPAAIAQARVVRRLRAAGHSLEEIRAAARGGRLAAGLISQLLPPTVHTRSLRDAAREAGVDPTLAERIWSSLGFARFFGDRLTEGDMELVRTLAGVQSAGLPLIALLQMARVYGQSLEQLADAEVRLFRLYVHEPLMAGNVHADEIAEHMHGMAQELLPVAAPVMEYVHQRFVQHFIDRELLGGLGAPGGEAGLDIGRVQVVIAFADVVGYTRLTEERGVHAALAVVERLTHTVEHTLPPDARVVKTIGDEVMIVGNDPIALTEWALAFQLMNPGPPQVRMGMHSGHALYRDGDYYGREVNLAARVVAHAQPGDVLVTRPIVDAAQDRMTFETAGRAALKGFAKSIELFRAGPPAA